MNMQIADAFHFRVCSSFLSLSLFVGAQISPSSPIGFHPNYKSDCVLIAESFVAPRPACADAKAKVNRSAPPPPRSFRTIPAPVERTQRNRFEFYALKFLFLKKHVPNETLCRIETESCRPSCAMEISENFHHQLNARLTDFGIAKIKTFSGS